MVQPDQFESRSGYFPALDGLRCLSVLMVICNHLPVPVPSVVHGYLGVDVFFVLSGFLITTLMLREIATTGRLSLAGFYVRRLFRIVPLYVLTIILYHFAVRVAGDPVKITQFDAALPYLLTFMREFAPESAGNVFGHAWSLGVEEKFYLLWPLLLVWLYPLRLRSLPWLVAMAVALWFMPAQMGRSYGGLLVGVCIAVVIDRIARMPNSALKWLPPDAAIAVMIAGAYLLVGLDSRFILMFSTCVGLLIASLVSRPGLLHRVLGSGGLVFVGRRSYAIYLVHVLAANAIARMILPRWELNWIATAFATFTLSLACAMTLHVLIERPCISAGRRLSLSLGRTGGRFAH